MHCSSSCAGTIYIKSTDVFLYSMVWFNEFNECGHIEAPTAAAASSLFPALPDTRKNQTKSAKASTLSPATLLEYELLRFLQMFVATPYVMKLFNRFPGNERAP